MGQQRPGAWAEGAEGATALHGADGGTAGTAGAFVEKYRTQ